MSEYAQLNNYISTVVDTIKPLFFQDTLRRISIVICTKERKPLESFCICFSGLSDSIKEAFKSKQEEIEPIDKASLESILRSFLLKLSTADSFFKPLPESKTFDYEYYHVTLIDVTFYVNISTIEDLSGHAQSRMQGDQVSLLSFRFSFQLFRNLPGSCLIWIGSPPLMSLA